MVVTVYTKLEWLKLSKATNYFSFVVEKIIRIIFYFNTFIIIPLFHKKAILLYIVSRNRVRIKPLLGILFADILSMYLYGLPDKENVEA